ncbi:MAG: DUF4418 family protein [Oscillospiraceae bacterium]|nr:DUF4418 family protein [Oscillospiraceae bacterium]
MEKKINVTDIALLVLSAALLIGVLTVFAPCGPKEDGGWMTCHWAGNATAGVAAVLTVLALVRLLMRDAKIRLGLSAAMIPAALLAALIPGRIIRLCMMPSMRCRAVMSPAVAVCAVLIIAAAGVDILMRRKKG